MKYVVIIISIIVVFVSVDFEWCSNFAGGDISRDISRYKREFIALYFTLFHH